MAPALSSQVLQPRRALDAAALQEHALQAAKARREAPPAPSPAAPEPAPAPALPEALWRVEVDEEVAPPVRPESRTTMAAQGRWELPLAERLTMSRNGAAAGTVWDHWVQQVEALATRHVEQAFAPVAKQVTSILDGPATNDVQGILALAGADVADHEATMRQVEGLMRKLQPAACLARVGPRNFRSLATVTRSICEQFMASRGESIDRGMGEEEAEECEWPEDLDARAIWRAGVMDFADWHRERRPHGLVGPVVLLVERADAVPPSELRLMLSSWGETCCREGIPIFVIFGLQQQPAGRFDLFEGEPLVCLSLTAATWLFDPLGICSQMLDWLAEDASCPLALPPKILDWLSFWSTTKQKSVTHLMKFLAVMSVQLLADNELGVLCAPLRTPPAPTPLGEEDTMSTLEKRLKAAPALVGKMQDLWSAARTEAPEVSPAPPHAPQKRLEVAQAAAKAVSWRHRLAISLRAWDALLCATQPLWRHKPRVNRLVRLLERLWPQESVSSAAAHEQAARQEKIRCDQIVDAHIAGVDGDMGELRKLLESLRGASLGLDEGLRVKLDQLDKVSKPATAEDQLRSGLRDWFDEVRKAYWQPLEGSARTVLLHGFCAKVPSCLAQKVEQKLGGGDGAIAKSELAALANPRAEKMSNNFADDTALLYRLVECTSNKHVEVEELWRSFAAAQKAIAASDEAAPNQANKDIILRFGHAIMALYFLGLVSPQPNGATGGNGDKGAASNAGVLFDRWRVRKRHFGRVWLKREEPSEVLPDLPMLWHSIEAGAGEAAEEPEDANVVEEVPDEGGSPAQATSTPSRKAPIALASRFDAEHLMAKLTQRGSPASGEKRRAPAAAPAAKRPRDGAGRSKVRFYHA